MIVDSSMLHASRQGNDSHSLSANFKHHQWHFTRHAQHAAPLHLHSAVCGPAAGIIHLGQDGPIKMLQMMIELSVWAPIRRFSRWMVFMSLLQPLLYSASLQATAQLPSNINDVIKICFSFNAVWWFKLIVSSTFKLKCKKFWALTENAVSKSNTFCFRNDHLLTPHRSPEKVCRD